MQATRQLPAIVEQHAEEAAFLWHLRDRAVDAPHYARRHLFWLEERLDAHLDGLVIAGELGLEIAQAQLDRFREPGEAFVVAALALAAGDPSRLDPVLELAAATPEVHRGLFGALGWTPAAGLAGTVRDWLACDEPFLRLLGLVACSSHRADPGLRLTAMLADPDADVSARAMQLAGELGRLDLRDAVAAGGGPWAVWAAAMLGDPLAIAALPAQAAQHDPSLEAAARLLAPRAAADWVRDLNGDPANRRLVVRALGAIGDPAAIAWLVGRMAEPDLARLAGESFTLITGMDLEDEKLEGKAPEGFEPSPGDDPADERVEPDPDDDLPWPDPPMVKAWWEQQGGRFGRGTRYLLGRAVGVETCTVAWKEGFQRQRRAAAYELVALERGTPMRNWRKRTGLGRVR